MSYKLVISNRKTKDSERAVLPTIIYASKKETERWTNQTTTVTCRVITIGWWAWGIGVMRTKVRTDLS